MKFLLFLVPLTSIFIGTGSVSSQAQNLHECDGTFSSSLDQIALCSSTREIDGLNVIGWGHLPVGVVAATCLTTIPGGVKESDIRFSTDYNWFTQYSSTGCSNAWDLGDIATHEIGHMIGLGHSVAGTDQVMNPYAYSCNYANRKLAKGDLVSLSHFYGGN